MGNCQCYALKSMEDARTEITAPDHFETVMDKLIDQVNLVRLILSFLDPYEQIRMQILNRHWYSDKGMGLYMPSIVFQAPYNEVYINMEPYCFMMIPNISHMMLLSVDPAYELTRMKVQTK